MNYIQEPTRIYEKFTGPSGRYVSETKGNAWIRFHLREGDNWLNNLASRLDYLSVHSFVTLCQRKIWKGSPKQKTA